MDGFDGTCYHYILNTSQCNNVSENVPFTQNYLNVHGYLATTICLIGIIGNFANTIVLARPKMANFPVNFLLMMIAISQLLLMATFLPMVLYFYVIAKDENKPPLFSYKRSSSVYLYVSTILILFFHSTAVWHTIAVAVFRWLTLGITQGKSYCTHKAVRICSVVLVVANIILTIPLWTLYKVYCSVETNCHFTNETFWTVGGTPDNDMHFWTYSLFGKMLPSILLTVLTLPLVALMRKHAKFRVELMKKGSTSAEMRKQYDQRRTTAMLLAVVLVFLCIELPHAIYIILMRHNMDLMYIYHSIGEIIDIVTLIAFSINFVLYTIMSRLFRKTFGDTFCGGLKSSKGFQQLSTKLTSVKQSTGHIRSTSSNLSTVEAIHLRNGLRQNGDTSQLLQPVSHPLLTENTPSTSMYSSNDPVETDQN